MIEGIIFDVDGTLLDSSFIWDDAGEKYLRTLGKTAEADLGKKLFTMSLEEGAVYLKSTYKLTESAEEILQGVLKVVENFYRHEAPLKEGVREFIENIDENNIPMVIASSSQKEHIEAAFTRLGIINKFKKIFTCGEVGAGKRNPEIFLNAAEFIGRPPEKICVFEDGLYAAETAHKAGFKVAGVFDEGSTEDWEKMKITADLTLHSMKQVDEFWQFAASM